MKRSLLPAALHLPDGLVEIPCTHCGTRLIAARTED